MFFQYLWWYTDQVCSSSLWDCSSGLPFLAFLLIMFWVRYRAPILQSSEYHELIMIRCWPCKASTRHLWQQRSRGVYYRGCPNRPTINSNEPCLGQQVWTMLRVEDFRLVFWAERKMRPLFTLKLVNVPIFFHWSLQGRHRTYIVRPYVCRSFVGPCSCM